jgi:hypothetical protein
VCYWIAAVQWKERCSYLLQMQGAIGVGGFDFDIVVDTVDDIVVADDDFVVADVVVDGNLAKQMRLY